MNSYRAIILSSSIVGAAQVANILAGICKMKVAAVLLGPAGVGLIGLYTTLIQTATAVSSLGLGTVGTRQVAAAHVEGGIEAVARTRKALLWATTALALIGSILFWLSSGLIARLVLGDESRTDEVAWLAIAVALSVAAAAQSAVLAGLRRIGDLARVNAGSGLLGAALGMLAVWIWGTEGLVAMILAAPLVGFLLGHVYVARLRASARSQTDWPGLSREWRTMAHLGFSLMLSGLVAMLGFLAARVLVQRELGMSALGHFQAAFTIGAIYLGFVLNAMGTDYLPRLTAVLNDREASVRLMNEQTEVALLLCAPALLAILGLAPWLTRLLYTTEFGPAVEVLRWQLTGDILKVMGWPLGYFLLAAGSNKSYLISEVVGTSVFLSGLFVALPWIGVSAAGFASLGLYVVYLPLVYWLVRRRTGFGWTDTVKVQGALAFIAAFAVALSARWSELASTGLGLTLAALAGVWALLRLSCVVSAPGSERLVFLLHGTVAWIARRK